MNTIASQRAARKLKEVLISECFDVGVGFRVTKISGLSRNEATFVIKLDNRHPDDEIRESHGIWVFLAPECAARLKDHQIVYLPSSRSFSLKRARVNNGTD